MALLTVDQRDEMLIRMDERVGKLREDMKQAKSAEGFARCQVHNEKVDTLQKGTTWYKRLLVSGIVLAVIKSAYDMFR